MLIPIAPYKKARLRLPVSEVVEGPYSPPPNVADNGLEDKIEIRLANGLAA